MGQTSGMPRGAATSLLPVLAVAALVIGLLVIPSTDAAAGGGHGRIRISRSAGEAGQRVVLRGRVPGNTRRVVRLQASRGHGWVTKAQRRSTARGTFRFSLRLPHRTGLLRYRVVAPGAKRSRLSKVRTRSVAVRVKRAASPTPAPEPIPPPPVTWKRIDVGATVCGLKSDDSAWCWGRNDRGQVGDGTTSDRTTPYRLPGAWRWVENADTLTCGLRTDDTAWCWGSTPAGAQASPTQVSGTWDRLALTSDQVCGIRTSDVLACWGTNDQGQLGDGTTLDRAQPVDLDGRWTWVEPQGSRTCGLQVDRTAWCWGDNLRGSLGTRDNLPRLTPTALRTDNEEPGAWTALSLDGAATCGLRPGGIGYCWGNNSSGSVGWGQPTDRWYPYRLDGTWRTLTSRGGLTCGVRTDDSAWCWGDNDQGQVGNGGSGRQSTPARLPGAWTSLEVSEYGSRVCGIQTDDSLWCWGFNYSGQVGDGQSTARRTPYRLDGEWSAVDATSSVTCGVRTDASGWCWGINDSGAVGNGTTRSDGVPTPLPGAWRSISARTYGGTTTCGIRVNGSGWCWGEGRYGSVGNGSTAAQLTPYRLP